MSWHNSRRTPSTPSAKRAARKARGEPVLCTCGAMTFQNHWKGHMENHHHARLLAKSAK